MLDIAELNLYLGVSGIVFTIGLCGVAFNRKNLIMILLCLELMLLAVNINLVAYSMFNYNVIGQVMSIFVLAVAAGEISLGLAIILLYFKGRGNIDVERTDLLKG